MARSWPFFRIRVAPWSGFVQAREGQVTRLLTLVAGFVDGGALMGHMVLGVASDAAGRLEVF